MSTRDRMKAKVVPLFKTKTLRARAQEEVRRRQKQPSKPTTSREKRSLAEIQIHEVELQMQNEELRSIHLELEKACERFANLYDFAACAYVTLDAEGRIQEANLVAASLLDSERSALIKEKFTRFIRADSQDAFYLFCRRLLSSEKRETTELELKSKIGDRLTVRVDGVNENPAFGEHCLRLSLTDITGTKRAEEAVQSSEIKLTDFFEYAPIGLQWLARDGTILRANRAQLEILGYAEEDYVGHRFAEFELDPVASHELLERLASQETLHNFRTRLRHKDGTLRSVLIDAISHSNNGQFLHFSIFTRDKVEQDLLEISERDQRRIAQDLHDDLGQVLTASIHLCSTLQKHLTDKSLSEASESSRVLKLLDQALAQTRGLARGLHPVKPETNGLMAALEELTSRTKEHFHVNCLLRCPRPVFIEQESVATHLYRIAQEAVTNAIKHGKSQRIEIGLFRTTKQITLSVRDDGVGLPANQTVKNGMGMRIMQYRASMIEGSLTFTRGDKQGMAVVCTIPCPKIPLRQEPT